VGIERTRGGDHGSYLALAEGVEWALLVKARIPRQKEAQDAKGRHVIKGGENLVEAGQHAGVGELPRREAEPAPSELEAEQLAERAPLVDGLWQTRKSLATSSVESVPPSAARSASRRSMPRTRAGASGSVSECTKPTALGWQSARTSVDARVSAATASASSRGSRRSASSVRARTPRSRKAAFRGLLA
jgi:hypothetical protein